MSDRGVINFAQELIGVFERMSQDHFKKAYTAEENGRGYEAVASFRTAHALQLSAALVEDKLRALQLTAHD